jgi:chromosome segregation ATPase
MFSIKTFIIGGFVLFALGFVLLGSDLVPYGKTILKQVKNTVSDAVPADFELERAQIELEESDHELHSFRTRIARLQVDIEDQQVKLRKTNGELQGVRKQIQNLSDIYEKSGRGSVRTVQYQGRSVKTEEVATELNHLVKRVSHLESRRDLLDRAVSERTRTVQEAEVALKEGNFRKEEMVLLLETRRFELEYDRFLGEAITFGEASSSLQAAELILAEVSRDSRVRAKLRDEAGGRSVLGYKAEMDGDALMESARMAMGKNTLEVGNGQAPEIGSRW